MRGTKLLADRTPLAAQGEIKGPEGSMVPYMQRRLLEAINYALAAVAADVREGLLETVGLESEWWTEDTERASVIVSLPGNAEPDYVVRAINLENLETWLDAEKRLHLAIGAWYTTKDIDQVVLCTVKVVHQFTGLLGVDPEAHGHSH